ncbi:type VI secretion system protein TssA [Vibrio genomosp. F6]|uniref:Type VI secretion system ImpA domain-containing protein n=1 Tax=Vibrio genomosp. F6 str. FF-238 TaxID=1191298 RepID=A0A1E5CX04_9VIBR|nr:type VI secretion system protein TssA [Vibrio genomosp. F6]OEE75049.1 type VI secretion system ImpA domain-containing protein [Vibrio genomosp. F6 str. FF-238]
MTKQNKLLTYISEGTPAGVELKYDERFEAIENEINNTNNLFSNKPTDWDFIKNHSEVLLESESKDYRLLNWYSKSIYKLNSSINNLISAVSLHDDFITIFGESAYPQRKRAQISILSDFLNFAEKEIVTYLDDLNKENLSSTLNSITSLDKSLMKLHQDDAFNLLPLIKKIKMAIKRIDSSKSEDKSIKEISKTTVLEKAKSVATHLLHIETSIESDRDANKAFRQIQEMSRNLTEYWLKQNSADTRVFKLNRSLTWLNIFQAPKADDKGITPLKPVPITKVQQYQTLLAEEKYADLLIQIEASLTKSPFWIDGHYMAWQCLEAQNKKEAATIICQEVSQLLLQFPELLELSFDDGTLFASNDTQSWIAIQTANSSPSPLESTTEHNINNTIDEWESELDKSKKALKTSTLASSIQPLISGYKQANSGRERFFWRYSQIKLLVQARKFDLASTLLNELDSLYGQNVLTTWAPDLQEQLLELWLTCLNQLPNKNQDPILNKSIRDRLCCLNPVQVISD